MKELNINEKIKKSIKFMNKKFDKAVIEVKKVNGDKSYIKLDDGKYEIVDEFYGKINGILIIQDGENNFYEFKRILNDVPRYFSGNGLVFLRYEIEEWDSIEYIENQFVNYFKLNKYKDFEEYILLESGKEKGLFITASYHVELIKDEKEYEDYTSNYERVNNKCGGCSGCGGCSNSDGCGSSDGCSSCKKGCCKK